MSTEGVAARGERASVNHCAQYGITVDWIILASFLFGVGIRAYALAEFPTGLHQDEASAGYDAYALLNYGIDRNGFHNPVAMVGWGSGMFALVSYVALPFIAVFGLSAFSMRLPFLLAGALGILLMAELAKQVHGLTMARVTAFLMAICPWHIIISRWALDSNLLPFVLLAASLTLVLSVERPWLLTVAFALFAISLYTYGTAYIAVPMYLAIMTPYALYHRCWPWRVWIAAIAIGGLLALPALLYIVVNWFKWESIILPWFSVPRLPGVPRFETVGNFRLWEPTFVHSAAANFGSSIKLLVTQNDGLIWNVVPGYGVMYLFSLPIALIGLVVLCRQCLNKRFTTAYFILAWCVTSIVLSALVLPNINRLNVGLVPVVYCTALGVSCFQNRFRMVYRGLLGLYAVSFVAFTWTYISWYPTAARLSDWSSFNDAILAASEDPGEKVWITDRPGMISYVFALFATQEDPHEFLRTVEYSNPGAEFQNVSSYGRYLFGHAQAESPDIDVYLVDDGEAEFSPAAFAAEKFGRFVVLRRRQ